MGPIEPDLKDRNLAILAERLRWPTGALEAVRAIASAYPSYTVYWSDGLNQQGPGYYARHADAWRSPTLYAATAEELLPQVAEDSKRRRW